MLKSDYKDFIGELTQVCDKYKVFWIIENADTLHGVLKWYDQSDEKGKEIMNWLSAKLESGSAPENKELT